MPIIVFIVQDALKVLNWIEYMLNILAITIFKVDYNVMEEIKMKWNVITWLWCWW